MATKLNDGDLTCFAIDDDTAVIGVKDQKFVVDYSTLMDFLTELAVVASQVENTAQTMTLNQDQAEVDEVCLCQRLH
ncbi:MAG: hypothetical protein NDI63_13605 [Pseudobdellovibrio sp.]|nr:hypothetical protein [Pseudobdellovibrio sp.]